MVLYRRYPRDSIYDPATFGDIPQELLEESLFYLVPGERDLVAASLVCRAWYHVAQRMIVSMGGCFDNANPGIKIAVLQIRGDMPVWTRKERAPPCP